jgi:uncharacterized metal-binding protein
MTPGCGCNTNRGETLIFTCAGAAHSGQVANRAGVQLAQQMAGKLFCIAAVAAAIPEKLERALAAGKRIAIDGCDDHCCRKVMEKAGIRVDVHVVATDLGVEKTPAKPDMIGDAKKVVDQVKVKVE